MAIGGGYGASLARRLGPDPMDDMEPDDDEEGGPPDEDADDAVEASAFDDFARAAGFKNSPAAYAAFKEAVRACMKR
jgi:hypothetical protein